MKALFFCAAAVLAATSSAAVVPRPSAASRVGARRLAPRQLAAQAPGADQIVGDDGLTDKQRDIQRLRDAEVFMTKDTGRFECRTCSYVYDPAKGDGLSTPPPVRVLRPILRPILRACGRRATQGDAP
jgi:hypothetical protein